MPLAVTFTGDPIHKDCAVFTDGQVARLVVPMPDPDRGPPDGMEVKVRVVYKGTTCVENLTAYEGPAVLWGKFSGAVTAPRQMFRLGAHGAFARRQEFTPFDGKLDYHGDGARMFRVFASTEQESKRLVGKELERLLAPKKSKQLCFNVGGGSSRDVVGLEDHATLTRAQYVAHLEARYHYHTKRCEGACGF